MFNNNGNFWWVSALATMVVSVTSFAVYKFSNWYKGEKKPVDQASLSDSLPTDRAVETKSLTSEKVVASVVSSRADNALNSDQTVSPKPNLSVYIANESRHNIAIIADSSRSNLLDRMRNVSIGGYAGHAINSSNATNYASL